MHIHNIAILPLSSCILTVYAISEEVGANVRYQAGHVVTLDVEHHLVGIVGTSGVVLVEQSQGVVFRSPVILLPFQRLQLDGGLAWIAAKACSSKEMLDRHVRPRDVACDSNLVTSDFNVVNFIFEMPFDRLLRRSSEYMVLLWETLANWASRLLFEKWSAAGNFLEFIYT